jgi:hypothetical protein
MMTNSKDILSGLLLLLGIVGFVSGEFIISSVLFTFAAFTSNVNRAKEVKKLTDI